MNLLNVNILYHLPASKIRGVEGKNRCFTSVKRVSVRQFSIKVYHIKWNLMMKCSYCLYLSLPLSYKWIHHLRDACSFIHANVNDIYKCFITVGIGFHWRTITQLITIRPKNKILLFTLVEYSDAPINIFVTSTIKIKEERFWWRNRWHVTCNMV